MQNQLKRDIYGLGPTDNHSEMWVHVLRVVLPNREVLVCISH